MSAWLARGLAPLVRDPQLTVPLVSQEPPGNVGNAETTHSFHSPSPSPVILLRRFCF